MTDQEIRVIIEAGVDRSEIEYIMMHSEIGEAFQDQLIGLLAKGDLDTYEAAVEELILQGIWDENKDEEYIQLELERFHNAIDKLVDTYEIPSEAPFQMQYLNLAYVTRHLFYNENDILSVLTPDQGNTIKFQTDGGEKWAVTYDTDSFLGVDQRLDPFDFAVLDVIYTLHTNEIPLFSPRWIDSILTGSKKRLATMGGLERIERSIEKLSYLNIQITIDGEDRQRTPLLSVQRFDFAEGRFYCLYAINDLYQYAADMSQIANVPAEYFDTSTLPKEYKFSDTETAIVIKRRIIARVMGILRQSDAKHHGRKHWNRISLIRAKEKKYYDPKGRQKSREPFDTEYPHTKHRGLFAELGLLPDLDGLDPTEQREIMSRWRKPKAEYMRVVRGTLEHLKQIYVIMDYEEVRPNESKSLREPVIGYDIICFNKTEVNKLKGMRDEQKSAYVKGLLDKRHSSQP